MRRGRADRVAGRREALGRGLVGPLLLEALLAGHWPEPAPVPAEEKPRAAAGCLFVGMAGVEQLEGGEPGLRGVRAAEQQPMQEPAWASMEGAAQHSLNDT